MEPEWIELPWRKKINDQQMDARSYQLRCAVAKGPKPQWIGLLLRRDDLQYGKGPIIARMVNRDGMLARIGMSLDCRSLQERVMAMWQATSIKRVSECDCPHHMKVVEYA